MNCEAVREMLWAYLEKEITAEEAVKIEEHLENCAACREELELQKEIMDSLQNIPDEELPDGFHAELMQKLQVEAAPNVVPFPVKKKKTPAYKQWGMIAAAVMVVVAAGGMNGMLGMRDAQNAAVQEMQAADMAAPVEAGGETFAVYDGAEDTAESETVVSENSKKMKTTASNEAPILAQYDAIVYDGAMAEESAPAPLAIARTAEVMVTDAATLTAKDWTAARLDLEKAIAVAEGFEELATEENMVIAVIPVETFDSFVADVENIGTVEWTTQEAVDENVAFRTVEIRLK